MAKKSQIFKSFADLAADMMQQTVKQVDNVTRSKRPRIIKTPQVAFQKVEYTPPVRPTTEEIRIHNAWNKYKNTGVYATMPEDQAYKLFLEDWNFRHNPGREIVKDLNLSINHSDMMSGIETPEWMRKAMSKVVSDHPYAFRRDLPATTEIGWTPTYVSDPAVTSIPTYFKPQQYRGVGNIDAAFENATSMSALGADDAASQFLSAGLKDVAAMARGMTPTSFKYKANTGMMPKPVLEEIVMRRNAPAGTAEWLQQINAKNPTLNTSYLDLFAKWPDYFKKMFNADGTLIK